VGNDADFWGRMEGSFIPEEEDLSLGRVLSGLFGGYGVSGSVLTIFILMCLEWI
jgi:hypothetical protein